MVIIGKRFVILGIQLSVLIPRRSTNLTGQPRRQINSKLNQLTVVSPLRDPGSRCPAIPPTEFLRNFGFVIPAFSVAAQAAAAAFYVRVV